MYGKTTLAINKFRRHRCADIYTATCYTIADACGRLFGRHAATPAREVSVFGRPAGSRGRPRPKRDKASGRASLDRAAPHRPVSKWRMDRVVDRSDVGLPARPLPQGRGSEPHLGEAEPTSPNCQPVHNIGRVVNRRGFSPRVEATGMSSHPSAFSPLSDTKHMINVIPNAMQK